MGMLPDDQASPLAEQTDQRDNQREERDRLNQRKTEHGLVKTSPRAAGLRPTAMMNEEKTLPIPITSNHADNGKTRSDKLCSFYFHDDVPSESVFRLS